MSRVEYNESSSDSGVDMADDHSSQHNSKPSDPYEEADQLFQNVKKSTGLPSWFTKRPGGGGPTDELGPDDPVPATRSTLDDDDVYDSDLDSVASDTEKDDILQRAQREHAKKMRKWTAEATNKYEMMLLDSIVNIDSIPPHYEDIFIDKDIIRQLERATKLSLSRQKAFSRGVLRGNRVTGSILHGPPGTGKTLLAKATARESGYNMLAVSTAELWQKCHGEDEKVIKALFSLGRKLFPCIVFLDEADALLGTRKTGEQRHIRSMLNNFLMEWDGLANGSNSPFLLLATNRPEDLDPAVLRRAPLKIHIDTPTQEEREGILGLLLRGETLEDGLDIEKLARVTPGYTGSDLKNLCVTAASVCVDTQELDEEERVLKMEHFDQAKEIIKASGEDPGDMDAWKRLYT